MALLEQTIDQQKLEGFLGKVIGDWGAANGCALALLGDRLGLYKAMTGAGPITPAELAAKTSTIERYVREWLVLQLVNAVPCVCCKGRGRDGGGGGEGT